MRNRIIISNDAPVGIKDLTKELITNGLPTNSRSLYKGRNKVVATALESGIEVNVKAFRIPIAINRFAYGWIRRGKARRAFEFGLKMLSMGVSTPRPFAYVECFDNIGFLHESYFVSEQLNGWEEIRFAASRPDFETLADALAHFVADFHAKGVKMKDLSPGNVLVRSEPGGSYHFSLVDTNRMRFGVYDRKELARTCGALFEDHSARRLFARNYVRYAGLPENFVELIMASGRC